jgi:hypothetical protein
MHSTLLQLAALQKHSKHLAVLARELFNYETGGQKEKAAELFQATFGNIVVAHTDKLRNFFLSPPTEMLSFLQQLREVLV